MSFRRFVYLVTDDAKRHRNFLLRRIDMSRFFFPKRERDRLRTAPPPMEEGRLPPATMKFDLPTSNAGVGYMNFMLFAGGDSGRNHKVVATDITGCALLFDPESPSIRSLPSLTAPKFAPVSLTVGNNLYILDTNFTLKNHRNHCFDGYLYDGDWYCHSLPPPPYVRPYDLCTYHGIGHVDSYAVVDGNIWISKADLGTHSFNIASGLWTKAGDWVLPFFGHAHYVPEHKLWFGLSYGDNDGEECDGSICASNLTVTPPTAINMWSDVTSPQWTNKSSYLVHLGHSRFCHASFFDIRRPCDVNSTSYVVLSGIEIEEAGGQLCVVKHRSEKCSLVNKLLHWLL